MLKKVIPILLLFCFGLYHFGYYILYFSYQYRIEHAWQANIFDENPDFSQNEKFMEIPFSMPYASDQEDFQPTNTSFEKNGEYFRVVKQRYANDTLQIIYVSDAAKNKLDKSVKRWISSLVNAEIPDGHGNQILTKLFPKDYAQSQLYIELTPTIIEQQSLIGFIFSAYPNQDKDLTSPPPEQV